MEWLIHKLMATSVVCNTEGLTELVSCSTRNNSTYFEDVSIRESYSVTKHKGLSYISSSRRTSRKRVINTKRERHNEVWAGIVSTIDGLKKCQVKIQCLKSVVVMTSTVIVVTVGLRSRLWSWANQTSWNRYRRTNENSCSMRLPVQTINVESIWEDIIWEPSIISNDCHVIGNP